MAVFYQIRAHCPVRTHSRATRLHSTHVDEAIAALRTLTEHRDDMVRTRTQTVNRLHVLMTKLVPAGLPRKHTADAPCAASTQKTPLARTLRGLATELIAEIRRLDRRIATSTEQITTAVAASGTTLTELHGIGDLLAAKVLTRTADVDRFRSAAAFASYCGVAPLEVSSGDVQRHRLPRAGDRQLNSALHVMAITQIRHDTAGQAYYQRKRGEGKGHKEALRCLKRRLADVVYRTTLRDGDTSLTSAT
ncbi:transposase [Actinacidiphila soli]|uniref:transposase n=1 Tax=Actinacidiphila soli TaxID=2487275 RepID=UPI0013E3F1D5|nr:transposase [Actinacidiphila soli]